MTIGNDKQEVTVRGILKNEITWAVFIIGIMWGAVTNVVMPLQKVQLQIAQVQIQLLTVQDIQTSITEIKQDHAVFKQQQDDQDDKINSINATMQRYNMPIAK